ncbi:MAG: hypothetical protein JW973_17125 [Bacteroidales bacterium]|nr:hypothetical protein [Bacteroidales bacterium]
MKKIISLAVLLIPVLLSASCIFNRDKCISCEIYDDYGYYQEYYGSECGSFSRLEDFEEEADDYAWNYYNGYAVCYDD